MTKKDPSGKSPLSALLFLFVPTRVYAPSSEADLRQLENQPPVIMFGPDALPMEEMPISSAIDGVMPVAQIAKNAAQGRAFEPIAAREFNKGVINSAEQVTVKVGDGTRMRLDLIGRDPEGNIKIAESKSSASARFTKNQILGFPQLKENGGTIVGSGKPGFPGGMEIPPTEVRIIRPADIPYY